MIKFITFLFVLAAATSSGMADEKCSEQNLRDCLEDLQNNLMNQLDLVKSGKKDLNSYCQTLENQGRCLKEGYESCKGEHPMISDLTSALHTYLNQFCKDSGKLYLNMVPCFENHKEEFERCWANHRRKRDTDNFEDMCKEVHSLKCVSKLSKDVCKNGEEFGRAMDQQMKKLEPSICKNGEDFWNNDEHGPMSRAGFLGINIWTLSSALLILFFVRNKLQ